MRFFAKVALLAAVYAVVGWLGLQMDAVSRFATLVWPPTGIALFALLRFGLGLWPGVALGAIVANVWNGAPLLVACGIGVGNTLEAVAGAWVLRRIPGFRLELDRLRDVLGLVAVALAATTISATVGVLSLRLHHMVAPDSMLATWRAWWLGDVVGALVVAPVLLTCWRPPSRVRVEPIALAVVLVAAGLLIFGTNGPQWLHHTQWLTPILIWAALRFGVRGAAGASLVICAIAVWGTARGTGPFVGGALHERLETLQGFIVVQAATFLLLGAVALQERAARALAERALQVREEFLSVASHELRTPATALQLSLQSLERKVAAGMATERPIKIAMRQTERLARLIDDLLDMSRIQAGQLTLEREPVDLVTMTRQIVDELAEELANSGCAATVDGDASVQGAWDRARLEQVLVNLLTNAMKYGRKQPIEVHIERDGASARLTVRDHGIGIAPDMQQKIFDPFERAVSTSDYGGLGLGLYIVRRIVEQHEGRIRVESRPGDGAKFVVELPISEA